MGQPKCLTLNFESMSLALMPGPWVQGFGVRIRLGGCEGQWCRGEYHIGFGCMLGRSIPSQTDTRKLAIWCWLCDVNPKA